MYFLIENQPQPGNRYQFRLMKDPQKPILVSEVLMSKADCLTAIAAARRAGAKTANYTTWDLVGNIRFNLIYGFDSLLIGTVRYKSLEERNQALQDVAEGIAHAQTRDQVLDMVLAA